MSSIINKLKSLQECLNDSTDIENAKAFIVSDKINAYEVLKNAPGTAKIAIGFEGEKARVNFPGGDITGRVNQTLYAIISRGRGLNQNRAGNLVEGSGGGSPLFQLAEVMRDKMRCMQFDPTTDEFPDYIGLEEWDLSNMGIMIDALICRVWVGTQLPLPVSSLNNPVLLPQ